MSQATSAPLWNVAKTPQRTCDSAATANACANPSTANATPDPIRPITTDSRRLTVSAITPVGISNTRYVALEDRPQQHELEGSSPSVSTTNTE